ncbi:oxidoreductase, partial [Streptomyces sp. NPDC057540]
MSSDATTAAPTALDTPGGPGQEPAAHGLGTSLPQAEARAKTEGTFPYASDLWAEGLLWAAILRSPHPHARIVSIDTTAAAAMPGVRAVVTAADVPGAATYGRRVADRPVFASELV